MSKHYELIDITADLNFSDEKLSWMNKLVKVKVKGSKWEHFPALVMTMADATDFTVFDNLKDFKVYDDDVFLCGFMRSGNTMMQEMIWLIVNDFDFVKAKSVFRVNRFPNFESHDNRRKIHDCEGFVRMEDMARPRCFKSHFPVQCLPDDIWRVQPKIIHMSRDVKDVVVSLYYFLKDIANIESTLDEFLQYFLDDKIIFEPYREHCLNYINLPNYPNILHLTYEYVTQNMDEAIHKVAEFLGKEISSENFKLLKEHMQFDNMKNNQAVNNKEYSQNVNKLAGGTGRIHGHIRRGKIGGYKEEMTPEIAAKFDKWMDEGNNLNQGFLHNS